MRVSVGELRIAARTALRQIGSAIEHRAAAMVQGASKLTAPLADAQTGAGALTAARRGEEARVLILSADVGGGHDAIARALQGELLASHPGVVVEIANGLQIGNPLLHRALRDGYRSTITHAPGGYGALYGAIDHGVGADATSWVMRNALGPNLERFVASRDPDVVVSTFPAITTALGDARQAGRLKVPSVGVLIDSNPHELWTHPGIDMHTVLNRADIARVAKFGSSSRPLPVTAIRPPVDPRVFDPVDAMAVRRSFGLPTDEPVVLVSGGSWGLAMPDAELKHIVDTSGMHVAVATGHNTEELERLRRLYPADRLTPIGFTKEMPALLGSVDGVVTNSAGMTTMEAFARERPVVLYRPLPGHGLDGAAALHDDGLATFARSTTDLDAALAGIRTHDPAVQSRVSSARSLFDEQPMSDAVMGLVRQ